MSNPPIETWVTRVGLGLTFLLGLITFVSVAMQTDPSGQSPWPLGLFLGIVVVFIGLFVIFVLNTLIGALRRGR